MVDGAADFDRQVCKGCRMEGLDFLFNLESLGHLLV